MDSQTFAVYVMADSILTFFVGITDNLEQTVRMHKENADPFGFTTRFSLHNLLYYELYSSQNSARNREQALRAFSKGDMMQLARKMNPDLSDLYERFCNGETPQILEKELKGKKQTRRKKAAQHTTVYSLRSLARGFGDD